MATVTAFKSRLPTPVEAGVVVPTHVDKVLFNKGFNHGMTSNQLTVFKASFRAGFRAAKRYLRELRRARGIVPLPVAQKMVFRP